MLALWSAPRGVLADCVSKDLGVQALQLPEEALLLHPSTSRAFLLQCSRKSSRSPFFCAVFHPGVLPSLKLFPTHLP